MKKELYGVTKDGKEVYEYTVINKNGMEMSVLNYGALLSRVIVPDQNGDKKDVVLFCDNIETVQENPSFFGAVIAPSANRIAKAEAEIDGVLYKMDANDGENNLHTHYTEGSHKQVWKAEELENGVRFSLTMEDMEHNLPGNRTFAVTYTLNDENEIRLAYEGDSDKNTIINITNHTYFNLDGHTTNTILNQKVILHASHYTAILPGAIPTGEIASVKGTPFDFTEWKVIGDEIDADFEQLSLTGGYDHNYVVDNYDGTVKEIAQAKSDETGIVLTVSSDMPGVQFYAGNSTRSAIGKEGMVYEKRSGFCFETQYFPDSVHHENFPSVIFGPERPFRSTTIFKFGV